MRPKSSIKKVLVYGAGEAGRQLVNSLENNTEFEVVGFIDDNKKLIKKSFFEKIYPSSNLKKLVTSKNVSLVFLAMPSIEELKETKLYIN